ncbi:MAG: protein-glutamine gamma-glutamyltransferase [Clostridia bacterium]|nr:protein-glutamine gamma-glutamyltransferase [Clostridia bacterium]
MILVAGTSISADILLEKYPPGSVQGITAQIMSSSSQPYVYDSMHQLDFELALRKSIVDASIALFRSNFAFRTFRESECNPMFWERTEEGGFLLKPGVKPSAAIRDIFINSRAYGTECATAIVILYYAALLNILPEERFDQLFPIIHLMDWQYLDYDLGIHQAKIYNESLPGDCRYFKNPDVDPITPEWQGENAIDLGNGTLYGHGIGIRTPDQFIEILNRYRIGGSQVSAFLTDSVTRPGFKLLASKVPSLQPGLFNPF